MCVVWVAVSMAAGESLYTAIGRDGRVVSGGRLEVRREVDRLLRLDHVELFSGGNPPILVRSNSVRPVLKPPYIRLINGDVLTGTVVRYEPSKRLGGEPVLWVNRATSEVPVRVSWVESIVAGSGRIAPTGSLLDAKGEVIPFTACRFVPEGIRLLSEGQVRNVPFGALAQVGFPVVDRVGKILREAAFSRAMGTRWMSRVTVADGSVMTGRRREVAMGGPNGTGFVQPVWAERGIPINGSELAWWSFHEVDALPLTLFAVTELNRSTMTGFVWSWRKDESLRGGVLASGHYVADTGLALHSRTVLSFKMPAGVQSISMWVGLDKDVQGKGCATVALRRDHATGPVLWERRFMTGKDRPQRVTQNLKGAKAVVLSVDFAHAGRPAGTDPLDIRDEVDFLLPYVNVSLPACPKAEIQARWCRLPKGWTVAGAYRFARLASGAGWVTALCPQGSGAKLHRTFMASPTARTVQMAWLGSSKQGGHRMRVSGYLDGKSLRDVAGRDRVDWHRGELGKVQHTAWTIPAGTASLSMQVRVQGMPATPTTGWIVQQLETGGPKKVSSPGKKLRK